MLLMAIGLSFTVKAQVAFVGTTTNPTSAIKDATNDTASIALTYSYASVSIQPVATKATGTMAGVVKLYYSVDGTNWLSTGDSLTLANVTTNTTIWTKTSPNRYWRVIQSGATTVTGTLAAKLQNSRN